jgi:hypothetical protein
MVSNRATDSALVPGVGATGPGPATGVDDGIDVRCGFLQGAWDQADGVATSAESAPYGRADSVSGADNRDDLAGFCRAHGLAPLEAWLMGRRLCRCVGERAWLEISTDISPDGQISADLGTPDA